MAITTDSTGFDNAQLRGTVRDGKVRLDAKLTGREFKIVDVDAGPGHKHQGVVGYVDEAAARETAEFFTKLAAELARRGF
jgi:hypothetical protein